MVIMDMLPHTASIKTMTEDHLWKQVSKLIPQDNGVRAGSIFDTLRKILDKFDDNLIRNGTRMASRAASIDSNRSCMK